MIITLLLLLAAITAETSIMRQMWMTPVQVLNLLNNDDGNFECKKEGFLAQGNPFSVSGIHLKNIRRDLLNFFNKFLENDRNQNRNTEATVSDLFYKYQQKQDLHFKYCLNNISSLSNAPETTIVEQDRCATEYLDPIRPTELINELSAGFYNAIKSFLVESFVEESNDLLSLSSKDVLLRMFIWTSVHFNGSYHTSHHHVNSAVSGVFYVSLPPGSGDIEFFDPRGALPPFGKSLRISPKEGDLILFPGYLSHAVHPTMTRSPRISVSFNFHGDWELLSDVNQGYLLNN